MRVGFIIFILSLLCSGAIAGETSPSDSFQNVEFATITVEGKDVTFPIGNETRKSEIFYLEKALKGDVEAREMFLGGKDRRWFFIGTEEPLWLYVDRYGFKVVDPNAV